jgi:hypothetical protein
VPADETNLPGPDDTPLTGATPDTREPGWYIPYLNAERDKPRYDQTVNGIEVGPTVEDPGTPDCEPGEPRPPTEEELAVASIALIDPEFAPEGAIRGLESSRACRDRLTRHRVEFEIPADEDADARLAAGEPWEAIERGGKVTVWKAIVDRPAFQSAMYAAERWRPATVNGFPAAIADPILAGGLGPSAVVVWDADRQLRVVIAGTNRAINEVIAIAEEVTR